MLKPVVITKGEVQDGYFFSTRYRVAVTRTRSGTGRQCCASLTEHWWGFSSGVQPKIHRSSEGLWKTRRKQARARKKKKKKLTGTVIIGLMNDLWHTNVHRFTWYTDAAPMLLKSDICSSRWKTTAKIPSALKCMVMMMTMMMVMVMVMTEMITKCAWIGLKGAVLQISPGYGAGVYR